MTTQRALRGVIAIAAAAGIMATVGACSSGDDKPAPTSTTSTTTSVAPSTSPETSADQTPAQEAP
ncbi:MAG: hypothetical protein Q4P32_12110, partial [Micrococcales bacterium]|nr:hypothetical protein [Micrococcales bacterium]